MSSATFITSAQRRQFVPHHHAAGHVLLDTGFEQTVPLIQENVAKLGFKFTDIKILLSSTRTWTTPAAMPGEEADRRAHPGERGGRAAAVDGGQNDFSPFPADMMTYAPVRADQILKEGDTVTLGDVTLTAHLTPGHTKLHVLDAVNDRGRQKLRRALLRQPQHRGRHEAGEQSEVSGHRARLRDHFCPAEGAAGRRLSAPHADAYRLESKLRRRGNGPNPFIDPQEFPAFVAQAEEGFSGNCGRNNPPRRKLAGPINFSICPLRGFCRIAA